LQFGKKVIGGGKEELNSFVGQGGRVLIEGEKKKKEWRY